MTARVLIVDDMLPNRMLLKAQLEAEYFQAFTASDGIEALALVERHKPDIVLLDVMMPGMTGFEVCRTIKSHPDMADIPVVLVTALDGHNDKLTGLEAGADDFLSKPVDETVLLARVRNLVRLKMLTDELRLHQNAPDGVGSSGPQHPEAAVARCRILLVDDDRQTIAAFRATESPQCDLTVTTSEEKALSHVAERDCDIAVVNLDLGGFDALRLCAGIRAHPEGRQMPLLASTSLDEEDKLAQAFDLGVNECITRPIDRLELSARLRTQLRKKHLLERLRKHIDDNAKLAYTDRLTGLPNRHSLAAYFEQLVETSRRVGDSLSLVIVDVDHFKQVNDRFGHDIGDRVLSEIAGRISANIRGADLVCRYGGEEFLIIFRCVEEAQVSSIAERLRATIQAVPIAIHREPHFLPVTVSVGVAHLTGNVDGVDSLFSRADRALYAAKNAGRNRVYIDAA